jgi:hypothetical protein
MVAITGATHPMKNVTSSPTPSFTVDYDDPFDLVTDAICGVVETSGGTVAPRRITIDRGEEIVERADVLSAEELAEAIAFLVEDGILVPGWSDAYLGRVFAIEGMAPLRFTADSLHRAAVKFGWAFGGVEKAAAEGAHLALHRTEKPATALEHLFVGLQFGRRELHPATLSLRLPGRWEPAIDFDGDAAEVERSLAGHVAVARYSGAYRLNIRDAAGKLSLLPLLGRVGGDRLHLDLSGACWLEAMRALTRVEPALFRKVLACAQERFCFDRGASCLFTGEEDVRCLPDAADSALEALFLDDPRGRQLLHVTRGSILSDGALRDRLAAALAAHGDLFTSLAAASFERHLSLLHAAAE